MPTREDKDRRARTLRRTVLETPRPALDRVQTVPDPMLAAPRAGPWPFVTRAPIRRDDGTSALWESRVHRKHHNQLDTLRGSTWWAPGAIAWWIGVLFMVGASCFALGALPGYAGVVGVRADDITYFVGSLFFTSAAALQYLEVVNADQPTAPARRAGFRLVTWEPRRIDWWASAVQLVGTMYFNVSTFGAMSDSLSAAQADRLVWRPDAVGSVCFLVASSLAWAEVGHAWISWRPRSLSWWIAGLNLLGSIAFGASAVGAKVISSSGELRNAALANLGTFVGALFFLVAAFLLLPERARSH